ncbi:MAG: hypothetical protein EZS28_015178 [Streblomastix strix]|uniref:Calcineurin-like phosphoesterase domain-containing protein n=1 Tax=Streblomastix strix TaxID=222440 RepID=A0A5J4W3Z1_9EUKA|nr:MAG: hypothetical protein EZS28_015178 [Streblomastix strix]
MLKYIGIQNKKQLVLFVFVVIAVYLVIFSYPPFRCLFWILEHFIPKSWYYYCICVIAPIILNIIIAIFMVLGVILNSFNARYITCIGVDYLIVIISLLPFIIILEIVFGVSSTAHQYAWIVCFSLIGIITIFLFTSHLIGTFILRDKFINLKSSKIKQPLRIVQISDIHIGSRNQSYMERIISRVIQLNGDAIFITGDLADTKGAVYKCKFRSNEKDNQVSDESELQQQPFPVMQSLSKLTAKLGVYFVTGNHDLMIGRERFMNMLQHFPNIRILSNEYVDITLYESISPNLNENHTNTLRIIGFEDGSLDQFSESVNNLISQNPHFQSNETSESPYTVILHHRPHRGAWLKSMDLLHGDLFLSGHTHNGQIFPIHPLELELGGLLRDLLVSMKQQLLLYILNQIKVDYDCFHSEETCFEAGEKTEFHLFISATQESLAHRLIFSAEARSTIAFVIVTALIDVALRFSPRAASLYKSDATSFPPDFTILDYYFDCFLFHTTFSQA